MALPFQPQNVSAQQADGNILISWQGSLGATGYTIQRSTDGVNFTTLASVGLVNQYVDSLPGIGIAYYYQVAATNISGTSPYSSIVYMVAAPPSEMSLYELRLRSQQTADRVNSNFVVTEEWNAFLRLAMYELYDLLITSYEDYFSSSNAFITTNGTTQNYPLPDGVTNYLGGTYGGSSGAPASALYKLVGVDLNVNTSTVTPSRVTLLKFDFFKRNEYIYPNSTSTIYGVYNMRYRLMGLLTATGYQQMLNIIPVPAGSQNIVLWYAPKLPALFKDTDLTTLGFSGWLRYVIVRAAKYALDKEEGTDTAQLDAELLFLKQRIEQSSTNRDIGVADTISETRQDSAYGGTSWGGSGSGQGGW
jgi:hypothetical protein